MKLFLLGITSIFSSVVLSQTLVYDQRIVRGEMYGFLVDSANFGSRRIDVWPPGTYAGTGKIQESSVMKEAKQYPFKIFKSHIEKRIKDFDKLSSRFNECVKDKKWPESMSCFVMCNKSLSISPS